MQTRLERYQQRVSTVLLEQGFVIDKKEQSLIKKRTANGRRYFFMVAKRREGKRITERFIKIPENNTKKLLLPFERQLEFARYLKRKKIVNTRGVIASNVDPKKGTPFAIMETFPASHAKIGFIEDNQGVERFGRREAQRIIDQLGRFHAISVADLPAHLKKILVARTGGYENFSQKILKHLNKKVKTLDHRKGPEPLYKVFERRLGIKDIKAKTKTLLKQSKPTIDVKANHKLSIVHGDMAPNNLYVFDSGDVEFLDLEWVGTFKNSAIAMIFDFGNLRARSWKNVEFKKILDEVLIASYKKEGKEALGKTIVKLSILRSHINLSGAFENYPHSKQRNSIQTRRREETEKDIVQAFSSI